MKTKSKIIISVLLSLLLMILITFFSVYHAEHLGGMYPQFLFFIYSSVFLSFSLGGFIVYIFSNKIESRECKKYLTLLPSNHRKILKLLLEKKEIEQNRIGVHTNLNNVQVSRIIKELEIKKLIEKKQSGFTNLIILK